MFLKIAEYCSLNNLICTYLYGFMILANSILEIIFLCILDIKI